MSGKNTNFDDRKINKSNFDKSKKLSKIDEIDVDKILVSLNIMLMVSLDRYV